jgi:hypothetical protein
MAVEGNSKSNDAVERWHSAVKQLEYAKSQVASAECELANAQNAAGKALCPADAAIGEEFQLGINGESLGLAERESLIVVKRTGQQDYELKWRPKGRGREQNRPTGA